VRLYLALGFFVLGVPCMLFRHFLPGNPAVLMILGGVASTAAYFLVLADTYLRRRAVPTRGGLLKFEEHPVRYRLLFVFWTFVGFLALFVLFAVSLQR
jgi:hypothetical protein